MSTSSTRWQAVAATVAMSMVFALLWYFHDRTWWPADEGVYAYVAQRILAGDRIHLDLIDLHGGYGNFANVLGFVVFGQDLLSLRYPLAALTWLQSGLVFYLVRDKGALAAAIAALTAGAFSFIQFLNPSANWYALFLCVVVICIASRLDVSSRNGIILLGVVLGLCFFTRQLSGVFLAMGTMTWLLLRLSTQSAQPAYAGKMFAVFLGLGLAGYLFSKGSPTALILAGIWPLLLIAIAYVRVNVPLATLARMLTWLAVGAAVTALPLAIYHAVNGAFLAWLRDIFVVALQIHEQDFIAQSDYSLWVLVAVAGMLSPSSISSALSSLGWVAVILAVPLTGYLAVVRTRKLAVRADIHPLIIVAPFWALVSIHYQIPVYLFFVLPVVLATFLALVPKPLVIAGMALLATWAVVFQAGEPISRGFQGTIEGRHTRLSPPPHVPRVSLHITSDEKANYEAVVRHIESNAGPNEKLMTIPMDPELNFITGRKSPVWYYGTPLGLREDRDVARSLERLVAESPLFVVHRRDDKYLTDLSAQLLNDIRARCPAPIAIGPFDIYRLPVPFHRPFPRSPDPG